MSDLIDYVEERKAALALLDGFLSPGQVSERIVVGMAQVHATLAVAAAFGRVGTMVASLIDTLDKHFGTGGMS